MITEGVRLPFLLMDQLLLDLILPVILTVKKIANLRMAQGFAAIIHHQILLGNISGIFRLAVFCQQMIKRLVACRPLIFRDGIIPFLTIRKFRINIINNPAKGK